MDGLQKEQVSMAGAVLGIGPSNPTLSASQYAACREKAQTIVGTELQRHEREAAAWRWLGIAMETCKPTETEEAALWDLLCRARREFR